MERDGRYIDFHTHKPFGNDGICHIYNQLLHENPIEWDGYFSAGWHPWYADAIEIGRLREKFDPIVDNKKLIAIGETGLDKVCPMPFEKQQDLFEAHLKFAEEQHKPVVIHCVKAWEPLMEQTHNYAVPKIIHGYNGSGDLTRRLVQQGYMFSIGRSILMQGSKIQSSINLIPPESIFCETDEAENTIMDVYASVSRCTGIEEQLLIKIILDNFGKLLNYHANV